MENQKVVELFAINTSRKGTKWDSIVSRQQCPFIKKKCVKTRKSEPTIAIGTCTVAYGKNDESVIICPHRLIENNQIFLDCIHLLTLHEPGNELQTLDTTGSVWGHRQLFLESKGIKQIEFDANATFGMNWKMTAKTILVQMHHKISTFENLNKHLVLVLQNCLMNYMKKAFSFEHISAVPKIGDSFHFHSYQLLPEKNKYHLSLLERASTDVDGIAKCLGLKAKANIDLEVILKTLESKISEKTLVRL